ncbi:hypothetical protein ACI3PL_26770, partial [Lacticaseibacillus paracasei]
SGDVEGLRALAARADLAGNKLWTTQGAGRSSRSSSPDRRAITGSAGQARSVLLVDADPALVTTEMIASILEAERSKR